MNYAIVIIGFPVLVMAAAWLAWSEVRGRR